MPGEIAARQLAALINELDAKGVDLAAVTTGVDPAVLNLDDIYARLDWRDYRQILDNTLDVCGPEVLRRAGAMSIYSEDAQLFKTNILLGYDSPMLALESMCLPGGVFKTIVPCMDSSFQAMDQRHCTVRASMLPGYPASPGHFEYSAGTIAEMPRILFEKPAAVSLCLKAGGAEYLIAFRQPSPVAAARRRWRRSSKNPAFLRAVSEVFIELSARQVKLQEESVLLAESEVRLRQAEKMDALGQLTGGVAHDFNNLLHVLQGNLDLLRDGLSSDADRALLNAAEDAVRRGADLTRQLLAFGRRSPLQPTTLDLNAVVSDMETLLRRTLGEQIAIETQLAEGLRKTNVDLSLLQTAVINLALNARDAMTHGGGLHIETANVDLDQDTKTAQGETIAAGRYVKATFSDTGLGMSEAIIEHAFDPFFTTKSVGSGSGLGLAMVYGFINQSSGMVRIQSTEGAGTAVELFLPEATDELSGSALPPVQASLAGQGEVVLVVEDDPEVCRTLVMQLEQLGYQPLAYRDGASALAELRVRDDIQAILTDIVLPSGTSGTDLVKSALALHPALGVVYISGYPDDTALNSTAVPPGAIRLAKPFQQQDLAQAIRHVVSHPAGQ